MLEGEQIRLSGGQPLSVAVLPSWKVYSILAARLTSPLRIKQLYDLCLKRGCVVYPVATTTSDHHDVFQSIKKSINDSPKLRVVLHMAEKMEWYTPAEDVEHADGAEGLLHAGGYARRMDGEHLASLVSEVNYAFLCPSDADAELESATPEACTPHARERFDMSAELINAFLVLFVESANEQERRALRREAENMPRPDGREEELQDETLAVYAKRRLLVLGRQV